MSENNGTPQDPIERKIAFIIDQQANFFADLEEVKTRHARTDARLDRAIRLAVIEAQRERVKRRALADKIDVLIDVQIRAETETASLREAQIRAEAETASLKEMLSKMAQAAEAETASLKEALREMAQAVTQTNRRIDDLSSNTNGDAKQ
jgi:predicted  nucleic acid-binding Zn-ribbon protein